MCARSECRTSPTSSTAWPLVRMGHVLRAREVISPSTTGVTENCRFGGLAKPGPGATWGRDFVFLFFGMVSFKLNYIPKHGAPSLFFCQFTWGTELIPFRFRRFERSRVLCFGGPNHELSECSLDHSRKLELLSSHGRHNGQIRGKHLDKSCHGAGNDASGFLKVWYTGEFIQDSDPELVSVER